MIFKTSCPRCGNIVKTYQNPFPTTDIIILRDGKVLLIRRRNPPPGWALPGGFIDYGESAESAARRELMEETGLGATSLKLFGVYSEPGRDPRFHTLSVVYLADAEGEARPGDDAGEVGWFPFENLPDEIAFDHRKILQDAFQHVGLITGSFSE